MEQLQIKNQEVEYLTSKVAVLTQANYDEKMKNTNLN